MQQHKSFQLVTTRNGRNQRTCRNREQEYPISNASDFDLSCMTMSGSLQHVDQLEPFKSNKRLFTNWTVKLNNDNQLIVEGTLECGKRARTKPIAERLDALKILSKFNHAYHLVGNMADSQYELPDFVRHRFQAGFPEDWQIVVEIWKSYSTKGCNLAMRSSGTTESFIVEKKIKLADDNSAGSHCFMECARKVARVDDEAHARTCKNNEQMKTMMNKKMGGSIVDYDPEDRQRSKKIVDLKRLAAWRPFVEVNENNEYSLAFRGTLLSSMGHAVSKNYVTDAIYRRLSARIIETVNREFYELIGDLNNTKRDVPKELVPWCRYGCPKRIHSFCEKLRILRTDEIRLKKRSADGKYPLSNVSDFLLDKKKKRMGQEQRTSLKTCDEKSPDSIGDGRLRPLSMLQPVREKTKRKRMPIELNDNRSNGGCGLDNNTVHIPKTYNENPGAILMGRRSPKIRTKTPIDLAETSSGDSNLAKGKEFKIIEQVRPLVCYENKRHRSASRQLTYVYHPCASSTDESILSDGV